MKMEQKSPTIKWPSVRATVKLLAPAAGEETTTRVMIPAKTKATPSKAKHHMVNEETVIQPERKFPSGRSMPVLQFITPHMQEYKMSGYT